MAALADEPQFDASLQAAALLSYPKNTPIQNHLIADLAH